MGAAQHQRFERPDRPKRNERDKFLVLTNNALALLDLEFKDVTKQAGVVQPAISTLVGYLGHRLIGDMFGGPYLTVRMGIAGPHHGAAVFKDLDVTNLRTCA